VERKEGNIISRRQAILGGLAAVTGLAAGSGIAVLVENLVVPSEPVDPQEVSKTVANVGLPAINFFLQGGIIKYKGLTQTGVEESPDGLPLQSFSSNHSNIKSISGLQVADFRLRTRFGIEFALPQEAYQRIITDTHLTDKEKNESISRQLQFLMIIISVERDSGSNAILYNRMMKDQAGNWTNASTHHAYTETTDSKLSRRSRSDYRPLDRNSLKSFVDDANKVYTQF